VTGGVVIHTTAASHDEAERIAEALVSERLAACVQIAAIRSRYVWKGAVERADEQLLAIKTRAALFDAVRARIRELSSYEAPEIIALPMITADPDYLAWLTAETREP